jgi:hypothetical protein
LPLLLISVVVVTALVIGGEVYLPPTMANREVQQALSDVVSTDTADKADDLIIKHVNERLFSVKANHYWIEGGDQHTADLVITPETLNITRDNQHLALSFSYDQTMKIPLLGGQKIFHYDDQATTTP